MMGRSAPFWGTALAIVLQLGSSLTQVDRPSVPGAAPARVLPKLLLWNASASVPRGLYWLHRPDHLQTGDLVAVAPPKQLASDMAARGYLPQNVPLLKHIGALPGQTVCRVECAITIDGRPIARARERDTRGHLLPAWHGCRRLRAGEVFLLNPHILDSFDGRYFGVLSASTIAARAEPLWTIPEH